MAHTFFGIFNTQSLYFKRKISYFEARHWHLFQIINYFKIGSYVTFKKVNGMCVKQGNLLYCFTCKIVRRTKIKITRLHLKNETVLNNRGNNQVPFTLHLKPRSHIACNRSATSLRPNFEWSQGGCRAVARRSATSHRPVGDGCRDDLVARRFWLLQVKPLCDQIDRRKVLGGSRQVAERSNDWLATDRRPVAAVADNPNTVLVANWSPTYRRSVADRSPKSCRLSAIIKKRSRYCRQPVADRSPIGCQSLPNWSPTDCRLNAGGSATTVLLQDSIV